MQRFKQVFLDLDGTLIDQFEGIFRTYRKVAESLQLPLPSKDQVLRSVGGSIPVTTGKLFPNADQAQAVQLYRSHFRQFMFEGLFALPGAMNLLSRLQTRGIRSFVFTNKDGDVARETCAHLGMTPFLEGIIGSLDTPYRKPQPEFTRFVLHHFNALPSESCLIGDSPYDAQSASCVQMPCFLVATGSHSAEELTAETACPVFSSLQELESAVFGLDSADEIVQIS